jgi:hypothetical protein
MNPENATTTTDRTTTPRTTTEPTSPLPDDTTPHDAASHTADATDATPAIEILVPMCGGGAGPRPDATSLTTRRR